MTKVPKRYWACWYKYEYSVGVDFDWRCDMNCYKSEASAMRARDRHLAQDRVLDAKVYACEYVAG